MAVSRSRAIDDRVAAGPSVPAGLGAHRADGATAPDRAASRGSKGDGKAVDVPGCPGWCSLAIPIVLCLVVSCTCLALIRLHHPEYLRDYRLTTNPDAVHYVLLGRNVILHGAYSRSAGPPFVPDVFRTPLYPLFAGGLDVIGGPLFIYLAQIFLHCSIVAMVHGISARAFGPRAALVAALVVAVHPTLVTLDFVAMSEVVFLALLLLSVLVLAGEGRASPERPGTRRCAAAGLLVGLSILARPAGLYFPLLVAVYLFAAGARCRPWRQALRRASAYLAAALIAVAPWIARNQAVFGIPHLTTNDTIVLVYFAGAGAYQVRHGVDRDAASRMIAEEYGLRSPEEMWNYHARGLSPREMDREARAAVGRVLTRYPGALVKSSAIGLIKAFFSHDAGAWAEVLRMTWDKPGAGGLLRLEPTAWTRLSSNHAALVGVFALQLGVNAILVTLAAAGAATVLWWGGDELSYLLLAMLAYFLLVCAANGCDTYTRFTAPSLVFMSMFAGRAVGRCRVTIVSRTG